MDELQIAVLKDSILKYLLKLPIQGTDLDNIYKGIHLDNITKGLLRALVEEIEADKVITFFPAEGEGVIFLINDKGEKLLASGGYTKPVQEKIKERCQQEADIQKVRRKTDLEIKNLKWGWWFSIAAILISVAALIISIFIK